MRQLRCPGIRGIAVIVWAVTMQCLIGCTAAESQSVDPWENTNRAIYNFNDGLDKIALKPASDFYVKVFPKEIRQGINNGFSNLHYFDVILNDFLQGNWQQGFGDTGRMGVNSTIGIAGVFDFATPLGLPKHENDFGITLGKWGAPPGPYIVVPLLGPSSVRDAHGIVVGVLTNPLTWVDAPWWADAIVGVTNTVDSRANAQGYFRFRKAAAIDDYLFTRDAYLQYRQSQISGGGATPGNSIYDEDAAPATQPASAVPASQPAAQPAPGK